MLAVCIPRCEDTERGLRPAIKDDFELHGDILKHSTDDAQQRVVIDLSRVHKFLHVESMPLAVVTAILAAIWFGPVTKSHVLGVDSYLLHAPAMMAFDHVTLLAAYHAITQSFSRQNPGFFPLGMMPLSLWLVLPLGAIKLLQFALLIVTFSLYALIIKRLTSSNAVAVTATVATIAAWQFRQPFDPVIGTSLVLPWCAAVSFFACYAWLTYCDSGHRGWLVTAFATVPLAMLTGIVPLCLMTVMVIIATSGRGAISKPASWFLLMVVVSIGAAILATGTLQEQSTISVLSLKNVIAQLVAAIPTTYRLFGHLPVGNVPSLYHGTRYIDDRFIKVAYISVGGWFAVVISAALVFFSRDTLPAKHWRRSLGVALALWLIPALSIQFTLEPGYRMPLGQGSEAVYFQYFGVGLLLAIVLAYFYGRGGSMARLAAAVASLFVFIVCYGNVRANATVFAKVARMDIPRQTLQRAGQAGFFDYVPPGTQIAVDTPTELNEYAFFQYTGRRYKIVALKSLESAVATNVWQLSITPDRELPLALYHIASVRGGSVLTDSAKAFYVTDDPWKGIAGRMRGVRKNVISLKDGNVLEAVRDCGPVKTHDAFDESKPKIEYGSGFFHSGPYGYPVTEPQNTLNYPKMFMGPTGKLTLTPSSCAPTAVNFEADVVSTAPGELIIHSQFGTDRVDVSPNVTSFYVRYVKLKRPITVSFQAKVPEGDLDHIDYRYEHDVPKHARLIFEPTRVWEDLPLRTLQH